MLKITELQQEPHSLTGESDYVYAGYDKASGLHKFKPDGSDQIELFVKRKTPSAGWCLQRGAWFYEYCRSA